MQPLDLVVLGGYLADVLAFGARFSRRQWSVRDYFLSGRQIPWWALLGSIVATETSTVTLISVPGYAFGGDLTFLQLAFGYVVGRIVVAGVLLPRLFQGDLMTAYQPLTARFGVGVGRLSASVFLLTRSLSDGFRLFATGFVLSAVLATLPASEGVSSALLPGVDGSTALLVLSVGLIGMTTLAYTLLGGMTAVILSDVVQLVVYMSDAVVVGLVLLAEIPGGWGEVMALARPAGKLVIFDFGLDLTRSYTFWSGLIGGMFLTTGTHGPIRCSCSATSAVGHRARPAEHSSGAGSWCSSSSPSFWRSA